MADTSLNNCGKCEIAQGADCASCKLASLNKRKDSMEVKEDDYSISERLTEKGNDHSILYLFLAGILIFGMVVLFSVIFSR